MKSRVIQDDPDDGGPPRDGQRESRPAEPAPARRRFLTRVLGWFRKSP